MSALVNSHCESTQQQLEQLINFSYDRNQQSSILHNCRVMLRPAI